MGIIKKGGFSGKVCSVCKAWKMLIEFPLDRTPGRFKGYRQPCCRQCKEKVPEKVPGTYFS